MKNRVRLHFKEDFVGFHLLSPDEEGEDSPLTGEIGHQISEDAEGRIVGYSLAFIKDPVYDLNICLSEARRLNIPGRYEVPELGLKDATFVEVLRAVRDYYARKLASRANSSSEVPAAA
ncbi:hypothetical protein [Thermosulfurimonas dismutans]|uniref:Uncharacterized protein n=1 Tax=Thermosulfurimonas dismutans TaxID=999894 RepID=A0A179D1U4_9BACT|nr:hypothetical protein [Thermosulfurimonas dismutans]OAQ20026.1 hypothetical protein TDIS_1845 [Thermosulfurimonas dismutans]